MDDPPPPNTPKLTEQDSRDPTSLTTGPGQNVSMTGQYLHQRYPASLVNPVQFTAQPEESYGHSVAPDSRSLFTALKARLTAIGLPEPIHVQYERPPEGHSLPMVTASSYQYNDGLIRAENISNTERPSTAVPQFMSVRRSQESSVVVTEALRSLGLYCETCIPLSQDLAMLSDSKGKSIDELKSVIALDINLGQLCRTADAGCQFCSFLMLRLPTKSSRMRQIFIAGFGAPSMMNDIACCSKSPSDNKTNAFLDRLAELRSLLAEQPDASFQFIVEPIQSPTDHSRFDKIKIVHVGSSQMGEKLIKSGKTVTVELYALEGDCATKLIRSRPINSDFRSTRSFETAKKWINECNTMHSDCPSIGIPPLPTRVLEITEEHKLRLFTPSGDCGHYVALSYCWGGQQKFATRSDTLQKMGEGFLISQLPQTLQDAIYVANHLGIKYVWIDSLCIIQDREFDKAQEIPKMAQYYNNAYVTISAASAKACGDGFLQVSGECEIHPGTGLPKDLMKMPYVSLEGKIGCMYFREYQPYLSNIEPISQRAWTLQERILSPRVLKYTSRLIWQCHTTQRSDGGLEDWSVDTNESYHRRFSLARREVDMSSRGVGRSANPSHGKRNQTNYLIKQWHEIVEVYSSRKMSVESDKLPAIGAVAAKIQSLTGDEYLAGLWRSNLPRDLLWSTLTQPVQALTWRAPSWSWASVQNNITYKLVPDVEWTQLVEIVDCNVQARTSNAGFGEIVGGKLTIKGRVIPLTREIIQDELESRLIAPRPTLENLTNLLPQLLQIASSRGPTLATAQNKQWDLPERLLSLGMFARGYTDELSQSSDSEVIVMVLGQQDDGKFRRFVVLPKVYIKTEVLECLPNFEVEVV